MFWFFHALMCPLSVSYVLPSVSLCLSVFSSMHSPRYLTCWSTSPVPRLVISVCVFSLCVPFTPCLVIVFVSLCLRPCSHSCVCSFSCSSCPHGMCSLDFDIWFSDVWFELWFFSLYFGLPFSCYFALLFLVATLPLAPVLSAFVFFCAQLQNKAHFCFFSLILPHVPCLTAFGSTSFIHSFPCNRNLTLENILI